MGLIWCGRVIRGRARDSVNGQMKLTSRWAIPLLALAAGVTLTTAGPAGAAAPPTRAGEARSAEQPSDLRYRRRDRVHDGFPLRGYRPRAA